jgi:hypothetical protein
MGGFLRTTGTGFDDRWVKGTGLGICCTRMTGFLTMMLTTSKYTDIYDE